MELLYIKRVFLFNKILHKTALSKPTFNMLYTVYVNDGRRLSDMFRTMREVKRSHPYGYQIQTLKRLIEMGFVVRTGFYYSITVNGKNALTDFEKKLRRSKLL